MSVGLGAQLGGYFEGSMDRLEYEEPVEACVESESENGSGSLSWSSGWDSSCGRFPSSHS